MRVIRIGYLRRRAICQREQPPMRLRALWDWITFGVGLEERAVIFSHVSDSGNDKYAFSNEGS